MSGKCKGCEFCFGDENDNYICADKFYGLDVTNSIDSVKDCYSQGFDDFIKQQERKKTIFVNGETISDIKIDGRRTYLIIDINNKILTIKGSLLKKIFRNQVVVSILDEEIRIDTSLDNLVAKKRILH